jgi:hypothetical protein
MGLGPVGVVHAEERRPPPAGTRMIGRDGRI